MSVAPAIPAGMPADLPYPTSPPYRCGAFGGGWTMKHKAEETVERGYFTGLGAEPPGHYLEHDGYCWMSTSRLERESHAVHVARARGTVVVCGVGMGMYLHNIVARPKVDRVVAVDRDPAVIAMIRGDGAGIETWTGREKLRFVQADALRLTPDDLRAATGGATVDYLYVDIWPELCDSSAVSHVQAIQRVVGAAEVGWWGQEVDFVEWAFHRRPAGHEPGVDDLRAFIAETGLWTGEPTAAYVAACRRAAAVYEERIPFTSVAAATR